MEIIHRPLDQHTTHQNLTHTLIHTDRVDWTTWWLWRGARTRSHPELGRENPQRPWYCVLRHGRVGRRQVLQSTLQTTPHAGWSSPVARQAHNLKVTGSNPVPATTDNRPPLTQVSGGLSLGTQHPQKTSGRLRLRNPRYRPFDARASATLS